MQQGLLLQIVNFWLKGKSWSISRLKKFFVNACVIILEFWVPRSNILGITNPPGLNRVDLSAKVPGFQAVKSIKNVGAAVQALRIISLKIGKLVELESHIGNHVGKYTEFTCVYLAFKNHKLQKVRYVLETLYWSIPKVIKSLFQLDPEGFYIPIICCT